MSGARVENTLTQRAAWTFLSNGTLHAARIGVTLLLTPYLIRTLGGAVYGAWIVLYQLVAYLLIADFRAGAALRIILGRKQHSRDALHKRRLVGAALYLNAATIPIVLTCGWLIGLLLLPSVDTGDAVSLATMTLALGILVSGAALNGLLSLPENLLRAHNLQYRAFGLRALAPVSFGIGAVVAVHLNANLVGLAIAAVLSQVTVSILLANTTRRCLDWFGAARPRWDEFVRLTASSFWTSVGTLGFLLHEAALVVILGAVLSTDIVAIYAVSAAVFRFAVGPVGHMFAAGEGGLAKLAGSGAFTRVARSDTRARALGLFVAIPVAITFVGTNRHFVAQWVGLDYYAGLLADIVLGVGFVCMAWHRYQVSIMDALGEISFRARAVVATGVTGVLVTTLLAYLAGLTAALLGSVSAQFCLVLVLRRKIAYRLADGREREADATPVRSVHLAVVVTATFALAVSTSMYGPVNSWLSLAIWAAMLYFITMMSVFACIERPYRNWLRTTVRAALRLPIRR
jgi:O-antigen/teichoic acid export membrane protein